MEPHMELWGAYVNIIQHIVHIVAENCYIYLFGHRLIN